MPITSTVNMSTEYSYFSAKYKFHVSEEGPEIEWIRKSAKHGFMIMDSWTGNSKIVCLYDEADYMMYLLRWK